MATKHLITALAVAALTACGGGGSDPAPVAPAPVSVAPGAYQGKTGSNADLILLALEGGEFWALYSSASTGGMLHGTIGGSVVDFGYSPAQPVVVELTQSTAAAIAGTARYSPTQVESFTAQRPTGYNYDEPVTISTIQGRWTMDSSVGMLTTDIGPTGAITGRDVSGCTFTGNVHPHGAKNVYDVALSFGPAPCALPGRTASGIALGDSTTMVVMLGDATQQYGVLAYGNR